MKPSLLRPTPSRGPRDDRAHRYECRCDRREFVRARKRAGSPAMGMVMTVVVVVDEDLATEVDGRRPRGLARAPCPGARRDPRRRPRRGGDQRPGRRRCRLVRRDRADPAQGRGRQAPGVRRAPAAAAGLAGCGLLADGSAGRHRQRRPRRPRPATDHRRRRRRSAARARRSTPSARRTPRATPTWRGRGSRRGVRCSPRRWTSTTLKVTGASVTAERISPSADLLTAWLRDRLKVTVARKNSAGPGITQVVLETKDGPISISRSDGKLATYSSPATRTARSRSSAASSPSSWPRSCAASTRTTCTPRPRSA